VSFLQPAGFQAFLELLEPAIDVIEALGDRRREDSVGVGAAERGRAHERGYRAVDAL
jgi:hypothetical protein